MSHQIKSVKWWLPALSGVLLAVSLLAVFPAQAAGGQQGQCFEQKQLPAWNNLQQVEARGFFPEVVGDAASLDFEKAGGTHTLSLELDETPAWAGEPVGARVTEVDNHFPPAERVKCWQPDPGEPVVAEFTLRYEQAAAPLGLTETAMLWNAPFGEDPLPMTAFGVTRSLDISTGQPQYSAIVAQNLVLAPFSGLLLTAPMPEWLDATAWHSVRVTLTQTDATVEVKQGAVPYTVVLATPLLEAPEPLAVEFSVDNELLPGMQSPVLVPDTMEVGSLNVEQ